MDPEYLKQSCTSRFGVNKMTTVLISYQANRSRSRCMFLRGTPNNRRSSNNSVVSKGFLSSFEACCVKFGTALRAIYPFECRVGELWSFKGPFFEGPGKFSCPSPRASSGGRSGGCRKNKGYFYPKSNIRIKI